MGLEKHYDYKENTVPATEPSDSILPGLFLCLLYQHPPPLTQAQSEGACTASYLLFHVLKKHYILLSILYVQGYGGGQVCHSAFVEVRGQLKFVRVSSLFTTDGSWESNSDSHARQLLPLTAEPSTSTWTWAWNWFGLAPMLSSLVHLCVAVIITVILALVLTLQSARFRGTTWWLEVGCCLGNRLGKHGFLILERNTDCNRCLISDHAVSSLNTDW